MIDLTKSKFGDKYKTRDGRMTIITRGNSLAQHKWVEGVIGPIDSFSIGADIDYFRWEVNGIAQEGFTWLDLIEKIE